MREGRFYGWKAVSAMVLVECMAACMTIFAKEAFTEGMSITVFLFYRQAIATLLLLPISILLNGGKIDHLALGMKGFSLVFLAALVGPTMNQYFFYNGLYLSSSSLAGAMINLLPAVTFLMALLFGFEKLKPKSLRTLAKVFGTIICVGGAVCMALFKGPMLHSFQSVNENWIIGFLYLVGSICCFSLWLILQVPICENYLDPLSLATWMCSLSALFSFILTLFFNPNSNAWKIKSVLQLVSCLFVGIFGSGVIFYLQSWTIAKRGPVFSAMFGPLNTVITTISGSIFLGEQFYVGSMFGAIAVIAVIAGLYIVLWGKAEDYEIKTKANQSDESTEDGAQTGLHDEPLLVGRQHDLESHN